MNKAALTKKLELLASGQESGNAPLVEAYLKDEHALGLGKLLNEATRRYYGSHTPLLPPSSCLPLLD